MPTKPDAVNDLPPLWGINGNYSAGVYGATLPWGDANPLAGQPLPWGGQPRLNTTGLTSFANTGLTPQIPTDASSFNEWLRRTGIWQTNWVALGTSDPDADAHIVETNGAGLISAQAFQAEVGIIGQGAANPLVLLLGADIPVNESLTFGDNTDLTMGDSAVLTGGVATVPEFEGYQLKSEKASTANLQIHHLGGEPRWRDSTDDYLHHGTEPWAPVGSVPALNSFGPAIAEIDGPTTSVTLTGTAFMQVVASATVVGSDVDTVARLKVEVDSTVVYNETFRVFNTDRKLPWSTSFYLQEGAGTFDAKILFSRDSGGGSVNLTSASIFVIPS